MFWKYFFFALRCVTHRPAPGVDNRFGPSAPHCGRFSAFLYFSSTFFLGAEGERMGLICLF